MELAKLNSIFPDVGITDSFVMEKARLSIARAAFCTPFLLSFIALITRSKVNLFGNMMRLTAMFIVEGNGERLLRSVLDAPRGICRITLV